MSAARRLPLGHLALATRLALATAVAAACLTARATDAHAEDRAEKAVCLEAMSKGQTLRDAHKLLEARDRFRTCSRQVCPTLVQNDCGGWLADVERALPTVVVSARSAAGGELFAVKVSMDNQLLVGSLDGQAIPINPGVHNFHFESEGMKPVDRQALVREGGKDQSVMAVLTPIAAPVATSTTLTTTTTTTTPGSGSGLRTAGFVVGSIGIAGLAVGTVFGFVALSAKSSDCPNDNCGSASEKSTVTNDAHVSTIGFIAGGALTAAGLGMVIFAPRSSAAHPETALRLVPVYTGNGGAGLGVGSSF
jgi:hypothetical protein